MKRLTKDIDRYKNAPLKVLAGINNINIKTIAPYILPIKIGKEQISLDLKKHIIMSERDIERSLARIVLQIIERNEGVEDIAIMVTHSEIHVFLRISRLC